MCSQVKYFTHRSLTFTKLFFTEVQISHFLTNFNFNSSIVQTPTKPQMNSDN